MIKPFLFVALTIFTLPSFAQDWIDESKMVGFACFFEGRPTELVKRFEKMLKRKRYTAIARELHSENPGSRVMAVFCLERLHAINKRTITDEEKLLIAQIKTSTENVPVCSGCFPSPGVPIQQVFTTDIVWGWKLWVERVSEL